ncbi:PAS domain-containing protein [Mucilaginibacter sp. SMC90]|uniref:PAS domain-containing protein n=1 Tax=Mucilaginibacter sp. SMC90 TaxID=2929803 RepID=UPI001FB2674A|nr:PAS domain-containing protein [Mucilaginibacter sp. SMC90]UOE47939.1 PAS domain-containing protein [Mucilaginibacter sp. SMC90]
MNDNIFHTFELLIKSLSVGSPLQNILFYTFILLLLSINIFLIRRKRDVSTNKLADADQIKIDRNTAEKKHPDYERLYQQSKDLEAENASLKAELLALGEELELSYNKSDKLNEQLVDILACLDLTISYDEHLWDWSIDVANNQLTLSEYGLRVRGYPPGTKLTWIDALDIISDDYRKQVETALTISLNTGADFSMVYKITPINGTRERWVSSFGKMIFRVDGTPLRLKGKFTFTYNDQMV